MLKRVIVFGLFSCIILACIAALIALKNPQWFVQTKAVTILFQASPSPKTSSRVTLFLNSLSPNLIPGQTSTIPVVIDTQNNDDKPHLIQLEIAYDPTALLDMTITPGNFFTDPAVLLNTIDQKTGRISYALQATTEGPEPTALNNQLAIISFTPNPAFTGQQTTLTFLGKTMIKDRTNNNLLTETQGAKLFFASSSAMPKQ